MNPTHKNPPFQTQMRAFTFPPALASFPRTHAAAAVDAHMVKTGFDIQTYNSNHILDSLIQTKDDLVHARKLFDSMPNKNSFTFNRMISAYAKSGDLAEARKLFDLTLDRTQVTWTIMIAAYAQSNCPRESFQLFNDMARSGVKYDHVSIAAILGSCQDAAAGTRLAQVHACVVRSGFGSSLVVGNTLVDSYCKCGELGPARRCFGNMGERDGVSYNAMLMGFSKEGFYFEALELFSAMRGLALKPSQFTFSGVLTAATGLGDLGLGRQVHGLVLRANFGWNVFVNNSLLDFYSKSNLIGEARAIFDGMNGRDNVSYNVMISGYGWSGQKEELVQLLKEMELAGFDRKQYPFPSLSSFAASILDLDMGKQIHAQVILIGVAAEDIIANSLIDMYGKCGLMETAKMIFDNRKDQNTVSWTAMISGYIQNGLYEEALGVFTKMRRVGLYPDRATFSSIFRAASNLASLGLGKQVHSYVIKSGLMGNIFSGSALLDMYAKCGCLEESYKTFKDMPEKNIVSWNAMIAALAHNGKGKETLELVDKMVLYGVEPDSVTFLSVLSACSHSGLVDEGLQCFESMEELYMIKPKREHYACVVDLLGRVGRLTEVKKFIDEIPFEPDQIIWNSVLNSSRIHGNQELASRASETLLNMEIKDATPFVIMSNMYSKAGNWEEAAKMKKLMRDRGVRKEPGYSWVEIKTRTFTFSSNSEISSQIRETLKKLGEEIEKAGYKPDTSCALQNVENEIKVESLRYHSERLAIAFAVMNTPPGAPIRVMKNLRACTDCHAAIKVMSKVLNREITVRDSSRFHHFKDGICSCGDYW